MFAGAGPARRRPAGRLAVPVHAVETRTSTSCFDWVPTVGRTLEDTCPGSSTSPPTASRAACRSTSSIDRAGGRAARRAHPGHRQRAEQCLLAAADLDDLHAAQPVPRRARGRSALPARPDRPARTSTSGRRRHAGAAVERGAVRARHSRRWWSTTRASSRRSRSASTCAPGVALERGDARRSSRPSRELHMPDTVRAEFAGDASAFAAVGRRAAAADPRGAARDLHRARRAVREPRASADHHLDAALGRARRAAGAADAPAPSCRSSRFIGIILLIGIVKKNGIMLVDFALEAERQRGLPPERAIHEACLERFRPIMMTTLAALLGAVPLVIATGPGLGAAPAARHHHHRRAARVADADALHDAGDLPAARPAALAAGRTARCAPRAPASTCRRPPRGNGCFTPYTSSRSARAG